MTVTILFAARPDMWSLWETPLRTALDATGVDYVLTTAAPPDRVDYIVYAPNADLQDFAPFIRLKAVLSLWAGVEDVVGNPTLEVPLARMVDPGLTEGMTEYVVGHVLRHHLGMDAQLLRQDGQWRPVAPPLARDRHVTMLGLGALGAAAAQALQALRFNVTGWSRSPKTIAGVSTLSGLETLPQALARADILVLLLPLTTETTHIMNAARLSALPQGAVILNPGRGGLLDEDALLDALRTGQVRHATLDTFQVEPLPPSHPFWAHPKVTVTPHIASETRPASAARVVAANVKLREAGKPLLHVVDRAAGY